MSRQSHRATLGLALVLLVASWALLFAGCAAGGTSGTGVKDFSGRVVTPTQLPLENVLVSIIGTDEQSLTDALGQFQMQTELDETQITFAFERADLSATFTLNDLPVGAATIQVTFEINQDTKQVEAKDVVVTEHVVSSSTSTSSTLSQGSAATSVASISSSSSSAASQSLSLPMASASSALISSKNDSSSSQDCTDLANPSCFSSSARASVSSSASSCPADIDAPCGHTSSSSSSNCGDNPCSASSSSSAPALN